MTTNISCLTSLCTTLAILLCVGACDNPVSHNHDGETEHSQVEGLVLETNGAELVRVEDAVVEGAVSLSSGTTTPTITITFLNEHGERLSSDDLPDAEYGVDVRVEDPSVASVEREGRFAFQLHGESPGTTQLVIELLHGAEGNRHADFTTPAIGVEVSDA